MAEKKLFYFDTTAVEPKEDPVLTPGNEGKDCLGNGTFTDENGEPIECCCDECDYAIDCLHEEMRAALHFDD